MALGNADVGFQNLTILAGPGDGQAVIGGQVCDQAGQLGHLGQEDAGEGRGDGEDSDAAGGTGAARGGHVLLEAQPVVLHVASEHVLVDPVAFGDGQTAGDLERQGSGPFGLGLHLVCGDAGLHPLSVLEPGHGDLPGAEAGGLADELGRAWAAAGDGVPGSGESAGVGRLRCWKIFTSSSSVPKSSAGKSIVDCGLLSRCQSS